MDDFPSNAKTTRVSLTERTTRNAEPAEPVKPKIEKVVTGPVIQRKKSLGKRLAETFGGGDAKGVGHFVVMDVLLPAAKDMVADAVSQGIERMVFGETRSGGRRTSSRPVSGGSSFTSYNRMSGNSVSSSIRRDPRETRDETRAPSISRQARRNHEFGELILATRAEGNEVLERLFDLVSQYGVASVNDLYEMLGVTGDYTDEKWGWEDLRGAGVHRNRNGYVLDLPKPEPLP